MGRQRRHLLQWPRRRTRAAVGPGDAGDPASRHEWPTTGGAAPPVSIHPKSPRLLANAFRPRRGHHRLIPRDVWATGARPGYSRWSCARMVSRTCYRLGCGVGDGGCVCGSFEVKRRLWPHFWPAAAVLSGVATAAERDRGTWPLSSSLAAGWPAVVATSTTTEKRTMRVA